MLLWLWNFIENIRYHTLLLGGIREYKKSNITPKNQKRTPFSIYYTAKSKMYSRFIIAGGNQLKFIDAGREEKINGRDIGQMVFQIYIILTWNFIISIYVHPHAHILNKWQIKIVQKIVVSGKKSAS